MPKRRVEVAPLERQRAYEHAIHDLVNTISYMKQAAENALNGIGEPVEAQLQRIVDLGSGRLTRTSEKLEPVYRGYRYAETERKPDEVPAAE